MGINDAEIIEMIKQYLPLLIPLYLAQTALAIAAIVHIFKHDKYRIGNRVIWTIVALFVQIIGPVLYFTIGRSEE